ncbi:DGK1 [Candida theae]|uniref:DGK1 n=1 Tax=Candida theae TaxID=1198502 RepID=A0AAD5BDS1_9ASCO|nr:DGK1 [Candida theae]KAI5957523.1 DGK1 [Candida theae]
MRFVSILTALVLLLLPPVVADTFSSVEKQFHRHINFLKGALPRRNALGSNSTNSLVGISNKGVPVYYDGAHSSISTLAFEDKTDLHIDSARGSTEISMPSKVVSMVNETGTFLHPVATSALHSKMTGERERYVALSATTSPVASYTLIQQSVSTSKFDPLAEINRLELLLIDLKEQMHRQKSRFEKQLGDGDKSQAIVTSSDFAPLTTDYSLSRLSSAPTVDKEITDFDDMTTATQSKVNGKQIMATKPPSNSVIIKPQFQKHKSRKAAAKMDYKKPKVAWSEVPATTTARAARVDVDETLGVLKEGEYTILFDKDQQIGYIDANAIQFAPIIDATNVPSTTQYEEYFVKSAVEHPHIGREASSENVSRETTFEQLITVEPTTSTSRGPVYDQDLIHPPPRSAAFSTHANDIEYSPGGTGFLTSRDRRMKMQPTKSFNFDVFDFDSQTKLNSGNSDWILKVTFLHLSPDMSAAAGTINTPPPKPQTGLNILEFDEANVNSYIEEEDQTYIYNTTNDDKSSEEDEDYDDDEVEDDFQVLSSKSSETDLDVNDLSPKGEGSINSEGKVESVGITPIKGKFNQFLVKHEIPRKVFHSSIGVLTLWLYTKGTTTPQLFVPLFTCFSGVLINDLVRLHNPEINKVVTSQMWFIIRENEKNSYNGTLFYLAGVLIVLYLYPKDISVLSILLLSWADTAASTVGRKFGKYTPKLGNRKSLAGSLGSFAVGTFAAYLLYGYFIPGYDVNKPGDIYWTPQSSRLNFHVYSILVGFIASVSELIDIWGLDDNFTIPVLSGTLIYWLVRLFHT